MNYIIGHRNPDADAICSAIAYADFKARRGETGWSAARCGNSNARIDEILRTFKQPLPELIGDVTPRVKDIMVREVFKIRTSNTIHEALDLMDAHDVRVLPALDEKDRLKGIVSVFQFGRYFMPQMRELKQMRRVHCSLGDIARCLKARICHLVDEDRSEELFMRIAAMDIRSFGKFSHKEGIDSQQSIIIVGDRWDIQQRSIQIGVRLLVVTGGLEVDDEVVQLAKEKGVSLLISPFDSATTAWVIRTATRVGELVEPKVITFGPEESLAEARRKLGSSSTPIALVTDDNERLIGVFSKTDLLKQPKRRLILVDHNEMSQAVAGAGEVQIAEIIDHHRLGSIATQQPILFVNEPVGSTCTIIADMFRREGIQPTPEIAGIMMGGIVTDTLHLKSPTTTEKDNAILNWLMRIAGVDSKVLADRVFSSGSVITSMSPADVIRADFKIYEEDGVRFSVSQIEELGFSNFWANKEPILSAVENLQRGEQLFFSCVLVTDINTQNSLLLLAGDREFIDRIPYPAVESGAILDMPGIVSRKKQLIPMLTSLLKAGGGSRGPFSERGEGS